MFERYTENARRALFFARYEASEFGDVQIKAEHLLLGLLRTTGTAADILVAQGVSIDDIRREIQQHSSSREKVSTSVEIPFTNEAKGILQSAQQEADNLLHRHIGTEHLLLAMLRDEKLDAAAMLTRHGVRYADARGAAEKMAAGREQSIHLGEVPVIFTGLNQLLDRLAAIAAADEGVPPLIENIRERLKELRRRLGA